MRSLWALILFLIGMDPLLGWEAKRSVCTQSCRKVKAEFKEEGPSGNLGHFSLRGVQDNHKVRWHWRKEATQKHTVRDHISAKEKQRGLPSALSGSVKSVAWQIRCGTLSATKRKRHWEGYELDAAIENLGFVLPGLQGKQLVSSPLHQGSEDRVSNCCAAS